MMCFTQTKVPGHLPPAQRFKKKHPEFSGRFLYVLSVCAGFVGCVSNSTQKSAVFYGKFLDNLNVAGYTEYAFRVNKESKKHRKRRLWRIYKQMRAFVISPVGVVLCNKK
jgi:hypothetical protein